MWAAVWLVLAELLFKFSFLIVRKAREWGCAGESWGGRISVFSEKEPVRLGGWGA